MVAGLESTCLSCEPHAYLEPLQPLPPAGFSAALFASAAALAAASSSAFFFISSSVSGTASPVFSTPAACSTALSALPALALVALQPLAAGLSAFSALPVPVLAPQPLLPAAWAPGKVMPPALIRPAIPRPARSFFKSLQSIGSSFFEGCEGKNRKPQSLSRPSEYIFILCQEKTGSQW